MKIRVLLATLLTLACFTAGHAETLDKAKLDQFLDRLTEKKKAMGSLTIAKDGKVLYTRAIGYSQINGTEGKPLTTANRFRIGSITKMFTATMILQLVEEGKLKLTEVLDKYVGVYLASDAPAKAVVTRDGSTLFFQPPGASSTAVPLEATAENKFQLEGAAVFTFDAAKNQMTIKRRGGERVFTKEK